MAGAFLALAHGLVRLIVHNSRFDRSVPGRPDFFTGRAAVDDEALSEKDLRERNAELTAQLNESRMRASRAEDECRDLRAEVRVIKARKPDPVVGLGDTITIERQKYFVADAAKPVARTESVLRAKDLDALHPRHFHKGKVPKVLEFIRAHPGKCVSWIAEKMGVTGGAVSFQISRYGKFITRQRDRHTVLLRIREGNI